MVLEIVSDWEDWTVHSSPHTCGLAKSCKAEFEFLAQFELGEVTSRKELITSHAFAMHKKDRIQGATLKG